MTPEQSEARTRAIRAVRKAETVKRDKKRDNLKYVEANFARLVRWQPVVKLPDLA